MGWEEGVVERLQRLIRREVFAVLGVNPFAPDILVADAEWLYAPYYDAIDRVRTICGISEGEAVYWYAELLTLPIQERHPYILRQLLTQHDRSVIMALSQYNVALKQRIV